MTRNEATQFLRDKLNEYNLSDWHIRLSADLTRPFLGMCSYKDKCIILNSFHIDTHPTEEVKDTILHEVAHALTPLCGHNAIWAAKAKEIGCTNTSPCASYGFSPEAIDAIRSGADLEITFEEEIIRTPKYKIHKLQNKCKVCGKVAIEKSRKEFLSNDELKILIIFECGHVEIKNSDSKSPFHKLIFDGDEKCKHEWNNTICFKCNAKRLYPYQIEGARALERANGRLAIFDEMGLGKTIQVLAYLKYNEDAFPYLWVTKSGIKYQHAKEIIRVLGLKYFPHILVKGTDIPIPGFKGYLCSYDLFRRQNLSMWEDAGIQTIVLDECQAIKNPDSSRTQSIRQVAKRIPKIIPLSGTPWKNRGSEFFVVLNMLDPSNFDSYEGFKRNWVSEYYDGNVLKEGGIKNPERFKEKIKHIAIRRERTEVMPELPLINRTRLICEVPDTVRSVYNEEKQKLIDNYNEAVIGGEEDSFANRAKMMQNLIVMRQIIGIAKVDSTVEFVKEFLEETDRKIVVFVHHKKCGEMIKNQLTTFCKENNYPAPVVLTAELASEDRFAVQEKFNSNQCRLMIASTLASGEGLNLQTCSDCIVHERQWNPANEEQAEGRFIRIGQKAQSVNATYVHGEDTIDTILDSIVEKKRIAFHNTMNKGQMATWDESSLMSDLIKELVKSK